MKIRTVASALAAVAVTGGIALAGMYNYPFASSTASQYQAATLPMSGSECIPADTYLSGGRPPQTECLTQGNLKGNYVVTLTDAATVTPAVGTNANLYSWTLGGARTVGAPTGGVAGQVLNLLIAQDATGSRTLTWNSVFKWPAKTGGATTAPTLSTTASTADLFRFVYDGTNWLSQSNQTTGQGLVP